MSAEKEEEKLIHEGVDDDPFNQTNPEGETMPQIAHASAFVGDAKFKIKTNLMPKDMKSMMMKDRNAGTLAQIAKIGTSTSSKSAPKSNNEEKEIRRAANNVMSWLQKRYISE